MKQRITKKLVMLLTVAMLMLSISVPAMAAVSDTGFSDVEANAWYAEAVEYMADNGIMNGTSETTFEPETPATRAMLVSSLYHQAGSPVVSQSGEFTDAAQGAWYSSAISWASENDIVSGYSDGRFGPDDPVTREQLATILWQMEGRPEADIATGAAFTDQASISTYATDAVAWARENGIISGKSGGQFDPAGLSTRAETASVLYQYFSGGSESAITITSGDTVISATLNNSVSARDLLARMPFTITMSSSSADYYASLRDPLEYEEADVHNGWSNGDIGFDRSGNYLTIFHSGEETSQNNGNQITLGRVKDLSMLSSLGASIQVTFAAGNQGSNTPDTEEHRTLVVYYSHSQRTETVAKLLQEKVGGDLYQLIPAVPYTGSDSVIAARSTQEIESGELPAFSGTLPDISKYDTILIGGPVWNYTVSAPLLSYLEKQILQGKPWRPFGPIKGDLEITVKPLPGLSAMRRV